MCTHAPDHHDSHTGTAHARLQMRYSLDRGVARVHHDECVCGSEAIVYFHQHNTRVSDGFPVLGMFFVIQGTTDRKTTAVENMRVDHRGLDILVAQEFLHGANIVALLK